MSVDYDDPAAVLAIIRPAYYALLSGGKAQTVEIPTTGGGNRRVTYHETDLHLLQEEVRRLEAAVATQNGGRPKRYAIRGF